MTYDFILRKLSPFSSSSGQHLKDFLWLVSASSILMVYILPQVSETYPQQLHLDQAHGIREAMKVALPFYRPLVPTMSTSRTTTSSPRCQNYQPKQDLPHDCYCPPEHHRPPSPSSTAPPTRPTSWPHTCRWPLGPSESLQPGEPPWRIRGALSSAAVPRWFWRGCRVGSSRSRRAFPCWKPPPPQSPA